MTEATAAPAAPPAALTTYARLADARAALRTLASDTTNALTQDQRAQLFAITDLSVPPEWVVYGMEALWIGYEVLPDAAKMVCGGCANLTRQFGFYGRRDRAYAIENIEAKRQGDPNADPTVATPVALETYDGQPNA